MSLFIFVCQESCKTHEGNGPNEETPTFCNLWRKLKITKMINGGLTITNILDHIRRLNWGCLSCVDLTTRGQQTPVYKRQNSYGLTKRHKKLKIHGQVQVYALYCDANQCWSVGQYNQFNIMSIVNDKMIISSIALKYCGTRPSNTVGMSSICILYYTL